MSSEADFEADELPRVAAEFLHLDLLQGLPAGIAALSSTDAARRIARCVHDALPADVVDLPPGLELTQWQLVFMRELARHVELRPRYERMTLSDWAETPLLDETRLEEQTFRPSTLRGWRQEACNELARFHIRRAATLEPLTGDDPTSALNAYLDDEMTSSDTLESWMAVAASHDSRARYHQAVAIDQLQGTPGEARTDPSGVALLAALAQGTVIPGLRSCIVADADAGKTWFMRYTSWALARASRAGRGAPAPIALHATRLPRVALDEGAAADPLVALLRAAMQEVTRKLPRKSAFYSLSVVGDPIEHLAAAIRRHEHGIAVLIDGLDEVDTDDLEHVTTFLMRLASSEGPSRTAIVVTSRSVPREHLRFGPAVFGRLMPLDRAQAARLARAWLGDQNRHLVEQVVATTSELSTPYVVVTRAISALRSGVPQSAFRSLTSTLEGTVSATPARRARAKVDAWAPVRIRDLSRIAVAYMSDRASAALNLPIRIEDAEQALDDRRDAEELSHRAPREAMHDLIRSHRHPRDALNELLNLGVLRAEARARSAEVWIQDPTSALAAVVGELIRGQYPALREEAPWLHESDSLLILLGEAERESRNDTAQSRELPGRWRTPVQDGDPFLRASVRIQSFLNAAGVSSESFEEFTALTLFSPVREHQRRAASVLVRSRPRGRSLCAIASRERSPSVRSAALAALIEVGAERDDAALEFLGDDSIPRYHKSLAMREFSPLMADDSLAVVAADSEAHPEWRLMAADQLRLRGEEDALRHLLLTRASDVRLLAATHAVGLDRVSCVEALDEIARDPKAHFESRVRAAATLDAIDPPPRRLDELHSDNDEVVRLRAIAEATASRRRRSIQGTAFTPVDRSPRSASYSGLWMWYTSLSPKAQFDLRLDGAIVADTYRALLESVSPGELAENCETAASALRGKVEGRL